MTQLFEFTKAKKEGCIFISADNISYMEPAGGEAVVSVYTTKITLKSGGYITVEGSITEIANKLNGSK